MKLVFISFLLTGTLLCHAQNKNFELWYKQPASTWTEALPVGNGRIGAMVYGDPMHENIQLNEESVWAGSKINNNNPQSKAHLPEIQEAIFKGDYKKALDLSKKYMVGTPPNVRSYQPLGNLFIQYDWKNQPTAYKRSLTLNNGISRIEFSVDGNNIVQEIFASAPQNAIVMHITATKGFAAKMLFCREFDAGNEVKDKRNKQSPNVSGFENTYKADAFNASFIGQIIDKESVSQGPGGKHMRYAAKMKIISLNGMAAPFSNDSSAGFNLKNATDIVLLITGATDYSLEKMDLDPSVNPLETCNKIISRASTLDYARLKKNHESDHRTMFERVNISLGDDFDNFPTDERLARVKRGLQDNGLISLYYQYGRYLLMGSSRQPARLPANLQGIWNDLYEAPWNGDFHTNINLQMNYWPAETGNLGETSIVLSEFMKNLMVPGAQTANEMYGAKGWTIHHLTDPFGRTGVMDGVWGITPMDGPWMTFPVYDHFAFTLDTNFLKKTAYPMIKGSVEFVLDILVRSPEGYLVTNPSHSPENAFYVPGTNKKQQSQMTYAPTVDIQIINELFRNFIHSAEILSVDKDLVSKVKEAQRQMPPMKISPNGTLQEWIEDFEETQIGHRHMSHLLGLYPLDLITPKDTVLFEAVKKSLARRLSSGGGHTGWSRAMIICLYARLFDGEKSLENINALFSKSTHNNLFDTHPPFQIDGNFGAAAGIAEMLMQSQNDEINILPALPVSWGNGFIHGVRARGACTADIVWNEGRLTKCIIRSDKGGLVKLRYKGNVVNYQMKAGESVEFDGNLSKVNRHMK